MCQTEQKSAARLFSVAATLGWLIRVTSVDRWHPHLERATLLQADFRPFSLTVFIEDRGQLIGGDALAGIGHGDDRLHSEIRPLTILVPFQLQDPTALPGLAVRHRK